MAVLHFVVKGWTVWAGLLTLALGLLLGLREPMPQGVLLIGMGVLAFVACLGWAAAPCQLPTQHAINLNRRDRDGISPKG